MPTTTNDAFALGRLREMMVEVALNLDGLVIDLELEDDGMERMMMAIALTSYVTSIATFLKTFIDEREDLVDPLRKEKIERLIYLLVCDDDSRTPIDDLAHRANIVYALIRIIRELERQARREALTIPLGSVSDEDVAQWLDSEL